MGNEVIIAAEEYFKDLVAMVSAFRDVPKRPTPVEVDIRHNLERLLSQKSREFFVVQDEAGHSLGAHRVCIDRVAAKDCRGIVLKTNETNPASVALHVKHGFSNGTSR